MDETKYVCVPYETVTTYQAAEIRSAIPTHVAVKRELLERLLSLADIALWKETAAELRAILESP